MTSQEFWRNVGRFLRDQREARDLTVTQVAKAGGLDPDTVKSIERGQPGRVDKLEGLLTALDFSIVDVLNDVLRAADGRPSLEAATLHRAFEQLGVVDRALLLAIAQRMVAALTPGTPPSAAPAPATTRARRRKGPPPH